MGTSMPIHTMNDVITLHMEALAVGHLDWLGVACSFGKHAGGAKTMRITAIHTGCCPCMTLTGV